MSEIQATAVFCDDIREEVLDRYTVVGIHPDNIIVPSVPGMIPKLGIYIRLHVPVSHDPVDVKVLMTIPGEVKRVVDAFSVDEMAETMSQAASHDAPFAGVVFTLMSSPFTVHEAGRIIVECEIGGDVIYCGSLNIIVASSS